MVRSGEADGTNAVKGWGESLADFFDPSRINIVDRTLEAVNSRTYITEGHWSEALALIKPGDVVLLQFRDSDPGALGGGNHPVPLPGVSDDTREIQISPTKQPEVIHTYGWYLRQYAVEAIARGAIPILCSPIPRSTGQGSTAGRKANTYGSWTRQIAAEQRVGFIDLDQLLGQTSRESNAGQSHAPGQSKADSLVTDSGSRASRSSTELIAGAVVAGFKCLPHDPIAGYFSKKPLPPKACSAPAVVQAPAP